MIKAEVIIYDDDNPKVKEKPYLLIPYTSESDDLFENFKFKFEYARMRIKEDQDAR